MAPAASNSMNLGGRATMEFSPRLASPCSLTMPSYMSQGRRRGRRSNYLRGPDEGLGGLAAEELSRCRKGLADLL